MAFVAASVALFSPLPMPMPMRASPLPFMIVRTSAKSMLISPGSVMRSEMPCTPWRSTSSAMKKASRIGVRFSAIFNRYWLGMVISVSTSWRSFSMPSSASCILRFPSKSNGFVTTATVSAPIWRATCATTGAAPVPVPPPMPAVMKTMSAPFRRFCTLSWSSSAAFSPISGIPPAPRPPVSFVPIANLVWALELCSACWSVLMATNDTFFSPMAIMRLTPLLPPPPTPTTLITVGLVPSLLKSSMFMSPPP